MMMTTLTTMMMIMMMIMMIIIIIIHLVSNLIPFDFSCMATIEVGIMYDQIV